MLTLYVLTGRANARHTERTQDHQIPPILWSMQLVKVLWSRNLRTALGLDPIHMHALMAQLAVLYEDLRIELFSATDYSSAFEPLFGNRSASSKGAVRLAREFRHELGRTRI
jgi:hypothetical protein